MKNQFLCALLFAVVQSKRSQPTEPQYYPDLDDVTVSEPKHYPDLDEPAGQQPQDIKYDYHDPSATNYQYDYYDSSQTSQPQDTRSDQYPGTSGYQPSSEGETHKYVEVGDWEYKPKHNYGGSYSTSYYSGGGYSSYTTNYSSGSNYGVDNKEMTWLFCCIVWAAANLGYFFSEKNAETKRRDLETLQKAKDVTDPTVVDPANNDQPVLLTGKIVVDVPAADKRFGIYTFGNPRLTRDVQVYCWRESKHEKTERRGDFERKSTEYSYKSEWGSYVNSNGFRNSKYDCNKRPDVDTQMFESKDCRIGNHSISNHEIWSRCGSKNVIKEVMSDDLIPRGDPNGVWSYDGGYLRRRQVAGKDSIGDIRICWTAVNNFPVKPDDKSPEAWTVVGVQCSQGSTTQIRAKGQFMTISPMRMGLKDALANQKRNTENNQMCVRFFCAIVSLLSSFGVFPDQQQVGISVSIVFGTFLFIFAKSHA